MNAKPTSAAGLGDGLPAWIAPKRTALVIIDVQVDFASPEGALGKAGVDMSVVAPAVQACAALADAARASGAPVVFVALQTSRAADSPAWRERMRRRGGNPDSDSGLCRAGTVGADFYGVAPLPGEAVIAKTRYSGFHGSDLDALLHALKVDTLVVCGLTTECCVDSTVRDAFHRDYHVIVAKDACAAYDPALHWATLQTLELNCAILASTAEIAAAWKVPAHG